jgi:hypothetical protein
MLFNDMLAILTARAKEDGEVDGLIPHLVDVAFSSCSMWMKHLFFWNTILKKRLI